MTLTNHLFSPYTFILNRAFYDGLDDSEKSAVREAAANCVEASRGLSRVIEASDRGLAGLKEQMEITALSPEERQALADVTQPAFEEHVQSNLDDKAKELLAMFKDAVAQANETTYLQ